MLLLSFHPPPFYRMFCMVHDLFIVTATESLLLCDIFVTPYHIFVRFMLYMKSTLGSL